MDTTKTCSYCKAPLLRRENESRKDFDSRVTCGRSCSNKLFPRRKLEGSCKYCKKKISNSRKYCGKLCINKSGCNKRLPESEKVKPREAVVKCMRKLKLKAVEYKGGKCQDCGYNKSVWALHFHHLNPLEKDFSITGRSISWERLKPELDKCVLLCANCHAERHEELHKMKLRK